MQLDGTASHYLPAEDLAVMGGVLAGRLIKAAPGKWLRGETQSRARHEKLPSPVINSFGLHAVAVEKAFEATGAVRVKFTGAR